MMTPMRTIIELPAEQLEALDALCRRESISRAEAIRRAVALQMHTERAASADRAFGLWKDRRNTGVDYERRIRREWTEHRPARRKR